MARPYVVMNVAMTADGKIDTVERTGATISSPRDKQRVEQLRADVDAVMVGGHTLLGDDPRLTLKSEAWQQARLAQGKAANPAKVAIISDPAALRLDSRFLTAGPARIILITTERANTATLDTLRARGVEVYVHGEQRVDLPAALTTLYEIGIERLLIEGGSTLNFEMLRLRLVDELTLYLAPLIFGGSTAPTLAGGDGLPRDAALSLVRTHAEVWEDGGIVVTYKISD